LSDPIGDIRAFLSHKETKEAFNSKDKEKDKSKASKASSLICKE